MINQTASDKMADMINEILRNDPPVIGIENNGIGFYEYGSATGFDKGADIPYIDEDFRIVKLSLDGFSIDDQEDIIMELIAFKSSVDIFTDENKIELSYRIDEISIAGNEATFHLKWLGFC